MPKKLPEYKVLFERVPRGKHALGPDDWINALGRRSKLGGEPDWIQTDERPKCSDCRKFMTFVGQIDSIEHNETANPHRRDYGKQDYMFGDVGMFYIFFCLEPVMNYEGEKAVQGHRVFGTSLGWRNDEAVIRAT